MKKEDVPGQFEQLVLTAVLAAGRNAHASAIRTKAMELGEREITFGSVFITLDRLEGKGYVASRQGVPSQHRGRRKRYYRMRSAGERALTKAFEMANRLQQAAEPRFRFGKQTSEIGENLPSEPADALHDVGLRGNTLRSTSFAITIWHGGKTGK